MKHVDPHAIARAIIKKRFPNASDDEMRRLLWLCEEVDVAIRRVQASEAT